MNSPNVSVVIPCYNRNHTIQRAIQSVLVQTYQDFEVVIVDDGSRDDSVSTLRQLCKTDSRIRCFNHPVNKGAQAARNTGIKAAKGYWIAFLDSDDEWLPNSLELRLAKAKEKSVRVVHSGGYIVKEDEIKKAIPVQELSGAVYRDLLAQPGPLFPTLLIAKEALERIGYLDEHISSWQEWETSIRLAKYYKFGFVKEPTFIYNCQGKDTISKDILRDAVGYEQIVHKHFVQILIHRGIHTLAKHYQILVEKYKNANKEDKAKYYKVLAYILTQAQLGTLKGYIKRLMPHIKFIRE